RRPPGGRPRPSAPGRHHGRAGRRVAGRTPRDPGPGAAAELRDQPAAARAFEPVPGTPSQYRT
ncbi:hypothetical protein PUR71_00960, partial [Streptomyces sp. SP17BM10]|uniref:hypothetical protein n=1 Tax=Streptomyces sp. SP17BM10 TaxID=3002530 RepID=UPI002E75C640